MERLCVERSNSHVDFCSRMVTRTLGRWSRSWERVQVRGAWVSVGHVSNTEKACETVQPKQDISRVDDTRMFRLSSFCAHAHRLRATVVCTDDKRNAPVAEEVSRFVKGLRKVSASRGRPRGPLWSAAGTFVSWVQSELVQAHLVSTSRHRFSFRRLLSDVVKRFADTSSACVFIAAEGFCPTRGAASVETERVLSASRGRLASDRCWHRGRTPWCVSNTSGCQ